MIVTAPIEAVPSALQTKYLPALLPAARKSVGFRMLRRVHNPIAKTKVSGNATIIQSIDDMKDPETVI
jgi:hypothetical protein